MAYVIQAYHLFEFFLAPPRSSLFGSFVVANIGCVLVLRASAGTIVHCVTRCARRLMYHILTFRHYPYIL